MSKYEFFANLSFIGWIGFLLWFVIPILVIATYNSYEKSLWFKDYDERFPKFDFVDNLLSQWGTVGGTTTWLFIRLIIMEVIMFAIGLILMLF